MCGFYQPSIPPLPTSLSLTGQTIIITGASRGIGYQTSLQLLRHNASFLILAVRDVNSGNNAAKRLLEDEEVKRNNPGAEIKVLECDLGRMGSVKSFAAEVEKGLRGDGGEEGIGKGRGLDLLVLNAGINLARWEMTEDGYEMLTQVNYLSNALLSLLLLPLLQKSTISQTPTITWVSSMGQNFTSITKNPIPLTSPTSILTHFSSPEKHSRIHRYPDSKLLVALFVRELGEHLKEVEGEDGKGVLANCVCPGTVDTTADDNLPFWLRIPMNVNRRLRARTVEEGANALLNAAEIAGRNSQGKYISNNRVSPLAPIADTPYGKEFGKKLWAETLEECKRIDGRLERIVKSYGLL